MIRCIAFCLAASWSCLLVAAETSVPSDDTVNCYVPIHGGWRIRISDDPAASRMRPGTAIGVILDDARKHRRPLYPPADRSLSWTKEKLAAHPATPYRPLIIAANAPRFLFDLDSDGGHSGHLLLGLSFDHGPSKWLHQFSDLEVRYVEGTLQYTLRDAAFPGVNVRLEAVPLADCVGAVFKIHVEGAVQHGWFVWAFGGNSGFVTLYSHNDPHFLFSPDQCTDNVVRWEKGKVRVSKGPLPGLEGGCSPSGEEGFGLPQKMFSPTALCDSASWRSKAETEEKSQRVAVGRIRLQKATWDGWLLIGKGKSFNTDLADPAKAERHARARCRSIADRVVVDTPDPYLNEAVTMMAFGSECTWADSTFVHGGWSWRMPFLGWRIWYGPTCYGWTDRVRHAILQNTTIGLIREGPDKGSLSSLLEPAGPGFYNMNEVFLDHVRQYYDYTNDRELMRKVFPVLKGIVQWEDRRLLPAKEPLYESSLDTWISDAHWYIRGQCTTASAYMLGAHRFLAQLAEDLGEDPEPYRRKAEGIRAAMQEKLWQPRQGVFAEYLDTLGHRQLHPQPELATIYHSAEFEAADPLQVYQMLHWADANLRTEKTPGGGRAVWSSNWAPNRGRSYTHSTYEMAYAEQLNLALANCLAGRSDDAYALLRSTICGIYNGWCPGGLGCHMALDGRIRLGNEEFADSSSMWARTVMEGVFKITPNRPRGFVQLSPQFPSDWSQASITAPQFSYAWKRKDGHVQIDWTSPMSASVHLKLPLQAESVDRVLVDDRNARFSLQPGVGLTWLLVETLPGLYGKMEISYAPRKSTAPLVTSLRQGDRATINLADYAAGGFFDPQGVLDETRTTGGVVQGTVAGEIGSRILFLKSANDRCPAWIPLTVNVESRLPIVKRIWSPPKLKTKDLGLWHLVDLSRQCNASVTEVRTKVAAAAKAPPEPALGVNHSYWLDHIIHPVRIDPDCPCDAAWRKKIGLDGVGWTHDGIPFKSPKEGKNIAVVTRSGGFPVEIDVPIDSRGKELYLMISGMTFPCQSHVVNLRIVLHYSDGTSERTDLVNPFGIGDCWGALDWGNARKRFHDTAANGFENIAGRYGPPGSAAVADLEKPILVDTEAQLVRIVLSADKELKEIRFEAYANDVIFGLMGASILK
jgi:hypothetical protein